MSFDLTLFAEKLTRCRTNLQLTTQEVADRIGMQSSYLKILEDGKVIPTGDEILMFADFYKQNYQYFISNQIKTASEQIQTFYRKFGDSFTKNDRWVIQEFIYLCECEHLAFQLNSFEHINFHFKPKGEYYKAHGENAAIEARKALQLDSNDLIYDIYRSFRKLGIHVFRRKLSNSSISGLFINHPWAGRCVLVNYDEDIYRQNFTVAHEVAHSIFDIEDQVNVSLTGERDLREIRANVFASSFLMPKDAIARIKVIDWREQHIINLAKQLKVNVEPLLICLKELGQINNQQFNAFKELKLSKMDKLDPELQGLTSKRREAKEMLLEKGMSSFYIELCYQAYQNGHISASKLADMCLVNIIQLPELLSHFNLRLLNEY